MHTFQIISDLVHDFMNLNALKLFKKFIKTKLRKIQIYTHTKESTCALWPSTYMQDKRDIPSMVNEKFVIKC